MKPDELAVAAGALSAALLDMLVKKELLTRQEATFVAGDAMNRVMAIRGSTTNADATLILSRLGQYIQGGK